MMRDFSTCGSKNFPSPWILLLTSPVTSLTIVSKLCEMTKVGMTMSVFRQTVGRTSVLSGMDGPLFLILSPSDGRLARTFIILSFLISTGYIRFRGVPCSQYIDIHHFGELQIRRTAPPCSRSGFQPAQAALYIACYILIDLGYFIGLEKSTLLPTQMPIFLGYIVDFPKTAFLMPLNKRLSSLFLEKVCSATKRYLLSPFRSCWKDKLLYTCRPCCQVVFFSGMFGHVKAL